VVKRYEKNTTGIYIIPALVLKKEVLMALIGSNYMFKIFIVFLFLLPIKMYLLKIYFKSLNLVAF